MKNFDRIKSTFDESLRNKTKVEISEYELYKKVKVKDKYIIIKVIKGLEINDNWL
jgi:hypothetical protein